MKAISNWTIKGLMFFSLAITAYTCDDYKQTNEPIILQQADVLGCEIINTDHVDTKLNSDHFVIEEVSIIGNCLKISVSYGGGCGEIDFKLFQSSGIMESLPPQMNLFLKFEDNDHCKALIFKELNFDLNSLSLPYNTGTIIFHLEGYSESIKYTY